MTDTFTQIIFPPKIKPIEPKQSNIVNTLASIYENSSRKYTPLQVYCSEKRGMVLLIGCLRCEKRTVPLESIFTVMMGC